jgi:hypothetical protein
LDWWSGLRTSAGIIWTVEAVLAVTIIVIGIFIYVQILGLKTVSVSEHRYEQEELANKILGSLVERGMLDALICREDYTSLDDALAALASVTPQGVAINMTVIKLMISSDGKIVLEHRLFSILWGAYDPSRVFSAATVSLSCSANKAVILSVSKG